MNYIEYANTIDKELSKKMDSALTFNKLDKESRNKVYWLIKQNETSLTSLYYKILVDNAYDLDYVDDETLEKLDAYKNRNLFLDYIVFKNIYVKTRDKMDTLYLYKNTSFMTTALKVLIESGLNEAKFILADILSLDLKLTKNMNYSYEMFKSLADSGHALANLRLAEIILENDDYTNEREKAIKYLERALDRGVKRAAYLLHDIYKNGFFPISKNSALARKYYLIFNCFGGNIKNAYEPTDFKPDFKPSDYIIPEQDSYDVPVDEGPDYRKDYKAFRRRSKNSQQCLNYLKDHFSKDESFSIVEMAKIYYEKNSFKNLKKTLKIIDKKYKMREDFAPLAFYIAIIYERDNKKDLAFEYHKLSKDYQKLSLYYCAKCYLELKDYKLAEEAFLILTDYKEYNSYFKLYQISEKEGDTHKGIEYLEQGAALDNTLCNKELGELYYFGKYVRQSNTKALHYFYSAYKTNSPIATFYLGKMIYNGEGCEKNEEKGKELVERAFALGFIDDRGEAAEILYSDEKAIVNYLKIVYEDYENYLCGLKLAKILFDNEKYVRAKKYFKIGKKMNDPESMYYLGLIAEYGLKSDRSYRRAIKLFNESYTLGYIESEYELGVCLYETRKYEEAHTHLLNSASDKNPKAYYYLSIMHHKRQILNASESDALYYAKQALSYGINVPFKVRGEKDEKVS